MGEIQDRYAGAAARRAAAMVLALGGTPVKLRMPAPPLANDDGEQLGLATPLFQDVPLNLAVLRRTKSRTELLVPAAVLEATLGLTGAGAIQASLQSAASVVAGDEEFVVATVEALESFGRAYLYRLGCVPARK